MSRLLLYTNGDFLTIAKAAELVAAGVTEIMVSEHIRPVAEQDLRAEWKSRVEEIERRFPCHIVLRGDVADKRWLSNRGGAAAPRYARARRRCRSVNESLTVLYNGDVNLCADDPSRKYIQGNIMERTMLDIWNHSRVERIRRLVAQGWPVTPECRKCLEGSAC